MGGRRALAFSIVFLCPPPPTPPFMPSAVDSDRASGRKYVHARIPSLKSFRRWYTLIGLFKKHLRFQTAGGKCHPIKGILNIHYGLLFTTDYKRILSWVNTVFQPVSFSSAPQPVIEILACLYLQFVISCSFSLRENFPKGHQAIGESFVCCEFQPLQRQWPTYPPLICGKRKFWMIPPPPPHCPPPAPPPPSFPHPTGSKIQNTSDLSSWAGKQANFEK